MPKIFMREPSCDVFQKISASEKGKSLCIRGGGGEYQDFPSKIFCLTVPKNSIGESFSLWQISGIENVRDKS